MSQRVNSSRVSFVLGCVALASVGCGSSPAATGASNGSVSVTTAGTGSTPLTPSAGAGAPSQMTTAVATAGAAGASPTVAAATGANLPCAVAGVIKQHCSLCHGAQTMFTAPMSLVTWDDLMAPSKSMPSMPVYALMLQRVQDVTRPMPPQPMAALTPAEIATLTGWVSSGTPKGDATVCAPVVGADSAAADGGAPNPTGAGGSSGNPGEDVQCYKFLANGGGGTKYNVPFTPNLYQCFYFDAPWGTDAVQGVSADFVVDNVKAVHHYILYTTTNTSTDSSAACPSGAHPDGQFVVGWAPGAVPFKMPNNVGLVLPGPRYLLETHYNAPSAGLTDASGIELCVTRQKREQAAATHPLGKEGFSTTGPGAVTGTCTPKGPFPVHILWSMPHMHLKGTHMQTIIHRANGMTETLIDKPFDFSMQLMYDTPTLINQGDTLDTTCTYDAAAQFGTGTNQEMCYNFVTAWPAGSLAGGPGFTGLSNNGNICINTSLGL